MYLKNYKTIVIKVGSSLLIDAKKKVRRTWLEKFALDIKDLKNKKKNVIIVSSGAIALGCEKLKINKKSIKLDKSQAVASICLLYTSPSPRDQRGSRMPSSA